jgi:hypothetical protein
MAALSARPPAAIAIAAAAILGISVTGAFADPQHNTPSTLSLSAKGSPTVNHTALVNVTGHNDPNGAGSTYGHFYLDTFALPAAVGSCPSSYLDASQSAEYSLGRARPETTDSSGNFSTTLSFTPTMAEKLLICAYTDDGTSLGTAASASLPVTVHSASKHKKKHKKNKHKTHH